MHGVSRKLLLALFAASFCFLPLVHASENSIGEKNKCDPIIGQVSGCTDDLLCENYVPGDLDVTDFGLESLKRGLDCVSPGMITRKERERLGELLFPGARPPPPCKTIIKKGIFTLQEKSCDVMGYQPCEIRFGVGEKY